MPSNTTCAPLSPIPSPLPARASTGAASSPAPTTAMSLCCGGSEHG
ncbi:MAG: hypothetical protein WC568_07570 [Candidatus Methanoperedens sp.]